MEKRVMRYLSIGLLVLAGCGSNIGGTTLAEARAYCEQQWGPVSDDVWDSLVIMMRTGRDDPYGPSKAEMISYMVPGVCAESLPGRYLGCSACVVKLIDAIW